MTNDMDALMARARQLEEENSLLRSMQDPSGSDVHLREENAVLRRELALIRARRASACLDVTEQPMPRTIEEFNALPVPRRRAVALRMTRQQRDEVLGRRGQGGGRDNYL